MLPRLRGVLLPALVSERASVSRHPLCLQNIPPCKNTHCTSTCEAYLTGRSAGLEPHAAQGKLYQVPMACFSVREIFLVKCASTDVSQYWIVYFCLPVGSKTWRFPHSGGWSPPSPFSDSDRGALLRYTADTTTHQHGGQAGLAVHRDAALLSFNVLLR